MVKERDGAAMSQLNESRKQELLRELVRKIREDFYKTKNTTDMHEWIRSKVQEIIKNEDK